MFTKFNETNFYSENVDNSFPILDYLLDVCVCVRACVCACVRACVCECV